MYSNYPIIVITKRGNTKVSIRNGEKDFPLALRYGQNTHYPAKRNLNVNYPTNSNIGDIAFLNALASSNVYIKPRTIELYGSDLAQAAETFENSYEHLDELGCIGELPLTKTEIIDVITTRLYAMCEEWLSDIKDHATKDRVLKEMIERKVGLKQKAAA